MRSPRGGGPQAAGFNGITVTPESGALVSAGTPQLLSVPVTAVTASQPDGGHSLAAVGARPGAARELRPLRPRARAEPLPSLPLPLSAVAESSAAVAPAGCRCHCRYHRRPAESASQQNAVIHPDAAFLGCVCVCVSYAYVILYTYAAEVFRSQRRTLLLSAFLP